MKPYHIQESKGLKPKHWFSGKSNKDLLKECLAFLRAQHFLYQSLHWQTKGYDLHILFERIYNNISGEIDILAEKMVSYHGIDIVDRNDSISRSQKWLEKWDKSDNIECALESENQFQEVLSHIHKSLGDMSLGLDDFLMNLANGHETHIYLLSQAT